MNLPTPGLNYDRQNEAQARAEIDREDKRNVKKGADIILSGNVLDAGPRLILKRPDGSLRRLVIDNSDVLTVVAV